MANIAMWFTIILTCVALVVVFIGIRNSVISGRETEHIKKHGKNTVAFITHAEQDQNQNAEGRLSLHLSVKFMANGKEINAPKDIIVKNFDADAYRAEKNYHPVPGE